MGDLPGAQIQPYMLGDALAVWEAAQESAKEIQPWMPWCHDEYSVDESREWIAVQIQALQDDTAFEFAIVGRDDQYLDGCELNQIDTTNKRANLGYWVRSSITRRGVATAAVGLLREWGSQHTDLIRLELVIAAGNLASQRVAEKAGAECEGTLRQRLWLYGTAHDARMCALLPISIKTRQHRVRDIRLSLGRGGVQDLPCVENVPDELLDIALVDERREDEALQANHRLPVVGLPVAVGHGDADAFAAHRPLV